jgi:polyhydroxyalkanoate synthase subunit PhaC
MHQPTLNATHPLSVLALKQMDRMRQARGNMLDRFGFAPKESPYTVLHVEPGVTLRKYNSENDGGPAVLLVPAPIKKAYIWDLTPEVSVVQRWLEQGYQVYLAEWTPDAGTDVGLGDYGGRLLAACQGAIEADSGEARLVVAGHSLGGILAAMFACLHPSAVRAVVLLESPLHFESTASCFAPLISSIPDAQPIAEAYGEVPGAFLNAVSAMAAPHAFQLERLLDRYLCMGNPEAMATHMRVERWTHDEFPLPGKLFTAVVEALYRHDRFMRGTLKVGDREIGPADLQAPLLTVVDPRSAVIPMHSVLPFYEASASKNKLMINYDGDVGVNLQHVGVLVGKNAHAKIWPAIFDWMERTVEDANEHLRPDFQG